MLWAWTRSLVFLWTAAAVFAVATFPGLLLSPPPVTGRVSWVDLTNRAFAIGALFLVAAFVHLRMRGFQLLEATISARKKAEGELRDNETRLRAGHIAGWEWNPVQDTYTWSQECYELFGMDDKERTFTAKWMSAISPTDLNRLKEGIAYCTARGEVDFEYQYEHPLRGTRWIHARAKMLRDDSGLRRMFGTCHDITERKQVELFLQQSKSLLESVVEKRTVELRKLSANLLQSQDDERRRIARELHDSFGQNLAGLKINLDQLAAIRSSLDLRSEEIAELLSDCLKLVQTCIVETRTLLHLLHPPLLDEAGFASAARWYVEEFARRSQIDMKLEIPEDLPRLMPALELALFRCLQESLTNVHRYSGSSSVDIEVTTDAESFGLTVRDYGRGVPEEILRNFREHGSGVGVGLSGMRERGTLITVAIPLATETSNAAVAAHQNLAA